VLLWFIGTSVLAVWFVFRDPNFDYRLLCLGALLPDLIDVWFGGARVMHTAVASVFSLVVVVAASSGRKQWRKRALAVPIGIMMHLIFDGAFSRSRLFWWPVEGLSFVTKPLPSIERGIWSGALEVLGAIAIAWIWRTMGLSSPDRRRAFLRTGCLHPTDPVA
jgi:hypothetical protein